MKTKLMTALAAVFTLSLAPAANAVVVVGGDNGWEVSFDGNINGFYLYEDAEATPGNASPSAPSGRTTVRSTAQDFDGFIETIAGEVTFEDATAVVTNTRQGTLAITGNDTRSSRVVPACCPVSSASTCVRLRSAACAVRPASASPRRSRTPTRRTSSAPRSTSVKCSSTWRAILAPGAWAVLSACISATISSPI